MKILVVHFTDDNFGDMLIEHCFGQLVRVVLDNLNIKPQDYEINAMGLKNYDENLIVGSDLICFAGGGVFGLSYLNLFEHLNAILSTAEKNNIPVIFSSIGVNNMDATDDNEHALSDLLKLNCIKAISVRENPQLFKNYIGKENRNVTQVCDPAVWTGYVYNHEIKHILEQKSKRDKKIIGVNVVRGGLFSDNGMDWTLGKEAEFLFDLKQLIEASGYECKFYTNGSTLDNNTMLYFRSMYNLSEDDLIFIDSTKELVKTIAGFDAVVAIRLHSAIICYSMDVPVINLVWNEKVKLFYNAINRPENALDLKDFTADNVISLLNEAIDAQCNTDSDYLMSLYTYLYETFCRITNTENASPQYSFDEIKAKLQAMQISADKDMLDMKTKLYKGQKRYYGQFMSARNKDSLLKKANKESEIIKNTASKQAKEIVEQKKQIDDMTSTLQKTQQALEKSMQKSEALQKKLNHLESLFFVRIYRKLQKIKARLRK